MAVEDRGVIYMAWGEKARDGVRASVESLWAVCPEMRVIVVGDPTASSLTKGNPNLEVKVLAIDPFRGAEFLAGRIKPLLYGIAPWQRTLYVDADTTFRKPPDLGFDLLGQWDFIVAETMGRTLNSTVAGPKETKWTKGWVGTPEILYHNSGMLFWRKAPAVEALFDLWSQEWERFVGWDEQVALLRALMGSEAMFLSVPYSWNTNMPSRAFMLEHRFGTREVWKHKRRHGKTMTAAEMRLIARNLRERTLASRGATATPRPRRVRVSANEPGPVTRQTGREAARREMQRKKPKRAPRNKARNRPRQDKG